LVHLIEIGEGSLEKTSEIIAARRASAEAMEGMGAFLEKRSPSWVPAK